MNDCGVPGCNDIARYQMPNREGDCPVCKASGSENTRGMDGKGRYGQEIRSRRSSSSSYTASSPVAIPNMTISPWAANEQDQHIEKRWNTPTRIKADDAWVIEHERRMNVVPAQCSSRRSSVRESTPRAKQRTSVHDSRRSSPYQSYERVVEAYEPFEVEEPEELEPTPSRRSTLRLLPYELPEELESRHSRQLSHDSDSSYNAGVSLSRSSRRKHSARSGSTREEDLQIAYRPRHPSRTEAHRVQPLPFQLSSSSAPIMSSQWESCRQAVYTPLQYPTYYPRAYVH